MSQFKTGNRVAVINTTLGGRFVFEGWAWIIRESDELRPMYVVQFEEEPTQQYERFVDPAAQSDPEAFVKHLNGENRRVP